MGYALVILANGERLRVEMWVFQGWRNGTINDPFLLVPLEAAIYIRTDDGYEVVYSLVHRRMVDAVYLNR